MHPAFKIPLSAKELQLLGEISVIQGQIEYIINEATAILLEVCLETVEMIYGPVTLPKRLNLFSLFAKKRSKPDSFLNDLAMLQSEIIVISELRNDFAHAIFGFSYPGVGRGRVFEATDYTGTSCLMLYLNIEAAPNGTDLTTTAYRTAKNAKRKSPSEIPHLRDRFAYASLLAGRMWHSLTPGGVERSPWRDIPSPPTTPPNKKK